MSRLLHKKKEGTPIKKSHETTRREEEEEVRRSPRRSNAAIKKKKSNVLLDSSDESSSEEEEEEEELLTTKQPKSAPPKSTKNKVKKSTTAVTASAPYHPIGTKLTKLFILDTGHRQLFTGNITAYDATVDPPLYQVTYDDGDWEEMTEQEVANFILLRELHCGKRKIHEDEEEKKSGKIEKKSPNLITHRIS